jgi:DNA repair protein RecN (Recombination protein N)
MLELLSIKNYALLVDVEIQFGKGLNILTGETGAGKSIIIGALNTILGERVDTTALRAGTSKAVIEGKFFINSNSQVKNYLIQQDLDTGDDQVILRREIYDSARSRAFINDTPVQLSILQQLGYLLVDLHGQHEHQSLLKVQNHLTFLDDFGDLKKEKQAVAELHGNLQKNLEELKRLEEQQRTLNEKKEFYTFQIQEINKVAPLPNEEEELLKEEKIVQHCERLYNLTNEFYQILYEDEKAVYDQLSRVDKGLQELQDIDERFTNVKKDCETALLTVDELAKFFQNYNSSIEFSPARLEEIQNRLSLLSGLKKKYGTTIEDVLAYRDRIQNDLSSIENLDAQIDSIKKEIESQVGQFSKACFELSKKRKELALQLEKIVPEVLSVLGMAKSRFKVNIEYQDDTDGLVHLEGKRYSATATGMDFAVFYISSNPGEDLKPLAKVASGGEISRVMLALKSIAAKEGQIPILIFDEIDMGISGRIAQAVGRKLKEISEFHQIICITHLPQIASMGDHHFSVEKAEVSGRTETRIRKLTSEERTQVLASLLAGEKISETHLKSARELLEDSWTKS